MEKLVSYMQNNFINLHCHTCFSLLDAVGSPEENAKKASEIGQEALAITDHGTLAGFYDFQIACDKHNIKPIFGIEAYLCNSIQIKGATDNEKEKLNKSDLQQLQKVRRRKYHLLLLAKNQVGLENLFILNYIANTDGFYYKPRIDFDVLEKYSDGLICSTACIGGPIGYNILMNDKQESTLLLEKLLFIFGRDNLYLEIQVNELEEQKVVNNWIFLLKQKYKLKCIVTNDSHYPDVSYNKAHTFVKWMNNEDYKPGCFNLFIASNNDIMELWKKYHSNEYNEKYVKDAINNTSEVASLCNAVLDIDTVKEPKFTPPKEFASSQEYFIFLLKKGFVSNFDKIKNNLNTYQERFKHEYNVITENGYVDYFLIVQDFINWGKKQDIVFGAGRGSVGGSLLAWFLGITEIDPIEFNLSFSRFIGKRKKSPDIDVDMPDVERKKVREYIAEKWGKSNIAPIISYSRYTANNLFRDVCKYLGLKFQDYNEVAKLITSAGKEYRALRSFEKNVKLIKKLSDFIKSTGKRNEIISLVAKLEGKIKNTSIAAAGTIISSKPLYKSMALKRDKKGDVITEWEGTALSKMKFLKMDMLGIRTLTIIQNTLKLINKNKEWLYGLKLNDKNIYQYFKDGKTDGVFQFESPGISKLTKNVEPDSFDDLVAINALYRPGPLTSGLADSYWKRKHKKEKTVSLHSIIDSETKNTYGLIVYQEQLISVFVKLGLDEGDADLLRRAIEEHQMDVIDKYVEQIFENKKTNLSKRELNDLIYEKILIRSGYSFNKSHSVGYSIISYWCQYLKYYFPLEFSLCTLNAEVTKCSNIERYLSMFKNLNNEYEITIGSIKDFYKFFKIDEDNKKLYMGLILVKGLGDKNIDKIIEFNKNFEYNDFKTLCLLNKKSKFINKKTLEILIKIGLFDNFMFDIENNIILNRKQLSLFFDSIKEKNINAKDFIINNNIQDYDINELLTVEYEFLGFSLSEYKLFDKYRDILNELNIKNIADISNENFIYGIVKNIENKKTKNNRNYRVITIKDENDYLTFKIWGTNKTELKVGNFILANIKKDSFGYVLNKMEVL